MEDRIRSFFATILQVEQSGVTDETRPSTLEQWDSMQHLILVSSIEEEFSIEFEPEEAVEMYDNFATLKRMVLGKLER